jgi:hypothetical protein
MALDFGLRVKYSFYSTLVFVFITNPMMTELLQKILGGIVSPSGALSVKGFFTQTILFFLGILGLMMFPKDN